MNRNFGKLEDGKLTYAPDSVRIGSVIYCTPTAQNYKDAGYLPIVTDNQPTGKVGVYYTAKGWEQTETQIQRTWEEHPIVAPVIVHKYSKLKLITAAKQMGKWDALKAFISTAGYEDEWSACMYLADDYAGFDSIIAAVVAAGVATEDEVRQILAEAEDNTLQMEG